MSDQNRFGKPRTARGDLGGGYVIADTPTHDHDFRGPQFFDAFVGVGLLNVRRGPRVGYEIVRKLEQGTRLIVTADLADINELTVNGVKCFIPNGWVQVLSINGMTQANVGWVHTDYLSDLNLRDVDKDPDSLG
jgi:hypothetical protein